MLVAGKYISWRSTFPTPKGSSQNSTSGHSSSHIRWFRKSTSQMTTPKNFSIPEFGRRSWLNACREMPSVNIRFALPNPEQPLGLPFSQHTHLRLHTKIKNPNDLKEAGIKELYAPDPERLHGTSQVSLIGTVGELT